MNTVRIGFWLRLGVIVGAIAGLAGCAALPAGEVTGTRSMTIYSDIDGASEILSGDYDNAIDIMLHARTIGGETRILRSTNLCVAYTLVGALESARDACDKAVHEATLRKNYGDWFLNYASFRRNNRYKARAFGNRSVLRRAVGDAAGATHDLQRAHAFER